MDDWTLSNIPPQGHGDVGPFGYDLWRLGESDKVRLNLPDRWMGNHRLWRGEHWPRQSFGKQKRDRVMLNLVFANIQRTVANLTAKQPVVEAVEVDAEPNADDMAAVLSERLRSWWSTTEQPQTLVNSAQAMEIYGVTIEKMVWSPRLQRAETVVVDPFAFGIAPGYYDDINDAPYLYHSYPMRCDEIEAMYDLKKGSVEADDVYSVLGEERGTQGPIPAGTVLNSTNFASNYADVTHPTGAYNEQREKRALVVELWVRDESTEPVEVEIAPAEMDMTGAVIVEAQVEIQQRPVYPGGIRVITFTNDGRLVLADRANPNINPEIAEELVSSTYLYNHYPFHLANSYKDTTCVWGFSAAEQTGDINLKLNELLTRIASYLNRAMLPPLIIPQDSGIADSQVSNKPGLILRPPTAAQSQGIRWLEPPRLSGDYYKLLDLYMQFFDRIWQIEDADRGEKPGSVTAASAIVALQERNAVLIRHKIRAVDYLIRQRGRCAISFYQNFGILPERVEVAKQTREIAGVQLLGRKFSFMVESGSTVHRTSLQTQEQAQALYNQGAIDRQALLENLNFPNWREIVERVGEGQLEQALQILVQAGLPQDQALMLKQYLMQPQGGPGQESQGQGPMPRAQQGSMPPGV